MKRLVRYGTLLTVFTLLLGASARAGSRIYCFEFFDSTLSFEADSSVHIPVPPVVTDTDVTSFCKRITQANYQPLTDSLLTWRDRYQLNDWLYYQLIRRVAQQISPKKENYSRYTLYKWFFLTKSGYDARLALTPGKIIFYVYNNEDISDIPFFMVENKKYMCLNYHDYPGTDLNQAPPVPVALNIPGATKPFSYKVTRMPDFKPEGYVEKELSFSYRQKNYHFRIKLNPEVEALFKNYPGVDFESYFNIPLSRETYRSLIPLLKQNVQKMKLKKGVDYLMRFTRYAFLYEDDEENFGKEKRLSAEETLFANYSDCDDRAALFFYLVKEIYNLPMIALLYPSHITIGVQFSKPVGKPVVYQGKYYSICEPTPQEKDLAIGQVAPNLKNSPYQIVYQYNPDLK